MNELNKTQPIQSPSNLIPNSGAPPVGSQVTIMSTNNPNYTTSMSNQNSMKQISQQQPQNHIQSLGNSNGNPISNQNAVQNPNQQYQQSIYRQSIFATQQHQTRQVIVHQQVTQNTAGQPTMIAQGQVPSSHAEHSLANAQHRYPQQIIAPRQQIASVSQEFRQRSDNQQMTMQAHQEQSSMQRSQSYQPNLGTGGTVLQVQQITQPTAQHVQQTIVVSQPQISIQNMPQQMHAQQHQKQFMAVNQNLMQNPPTQVAQQQQQIHGQPQQGISHQIQHSISTQNQAFQIQRITGSPRPNTTVSMQQSGKHVPTPTHLAAALTNPPPNRPDMMQSTSTSLPQTMHFVSANTSNMNSTAQQQHPVNTQQVQIRVQHMPISASLNTIPHTLDGASFATAGQPMFAVPFQRAPIQKANGPLVGTSNNLAVREAATNAKERYRQIKRKFKFLVYENECYQDELRNLQRKLLKLSRDKNFLLDRLQQHERLSDSSDESDSSAKTIEDKTAKSKKKPTASRKKPPATTAAAKKTSNANAAKSTQTKAKVEIVNLPSTSSSIKLEPIMDTTSNTDSVKNYVQSPSITPLSSDPQSSYVLKKEVLSSPTSQSSGSITMNPVMQSYQNELKNQPHNLAISENTQISTSSSNNLP